MFILFDPETVAYVKTWLNLTVNTNLLEKIWYLKGYNEVFRLF
jgi:hypothetical protein